MPAPRTPIAKPKPQAGTRKGSGRVAVEGVDGRSTMGRRFREIVSTLFADLGGDPTEAQRAIASRAATLAIWCEQAETDFANGKAFDVATYATSANAMRRLLADLGLERRSRDITPTLSQYLSGRAVANG